MAKKHKKRKKSAEVSSESALKTAVKSINWKLVGRVFSLFVLVFSVYQMCMHIAVKLNSFAIQQATTIVYAVILTLLGVAFVFVNGGISSDIPTKEQLVDTMSDKEKEEFIAFVKQRRAKAKKILIYLIPFVFTLLLDTLYLLLFIK